MIYNVYTATPQSQQDPTNGIAVPRRDTGAYGADGAPWRYAALVVNFIL
eukprot:SAG31_NODE_38234_length_297_cov_25.136364_1_plen_49_part_00